MFWTSCRIVGAVECGFSWDAVFGRQLCILASLKVICGELLMATRWHQSVPSIALLSHATALFCFFFEFLLKLGRHVALKRADVRNDDGLELITSLRNGWLSDGHTKLISWALLLFCASNDLVRAGWLLAFGPYLKFLHAVPSLQMRFVNNFFFLFCKKLFYYIKIRFWSLSALNLNVFATVP
jgi:hypothetical protein